MTQTVQAELLDDAAVVTAKIADDAVATAKVADGAITTAKLGASSVTSAKMATNSVVTAAITDANVTPAKLSQPLTQGTAVASTSGTSIDFTGIPSWVKRITVMFSGVSTNGTSNLQIQLGDSGGFETTGYASAAQSGATASASTAGYILTQTVSAATAAYAGHCVITLSGSNLWVASSVISSTNASFGLSYAGGTKTLSDTLTQVRITTVNGTDTFDAGSINILYE